MTSADDEIILTVLGNFTQQLSRMAAALLLWSLFHSLHIFGQAPIVQILVHTYVNAYHIQITRTHTEGSMSLVSHIIYSHSVYSFTRSIMHITNAHITHNVYI
jgi:hypothetical protein